MNPKSYKLISAALLCFMLTVCIAAPAKADSTYTYTGNPFTGFYGGASCPPSCSLSGSFTVSSPLAPGLVFGTVTPVSFSFTDGGFTITSSDYSGNIFVDTNSLGQIDGWQIDIVSGPSSSHYQIVSTLSGDQGSYYTTSTSSQAYNSEDPGTWAASTTGVPEPPSLVMLSIGILALAMLSFKRLTIR